MKRALPLERMFFLAGPTGCGKTSLALRLAKHCQGEIVNADAFQVYQGIDTLVAMPTEQERRAVPHHLYDIIPTGQDFDVAQYAQLVSPVVTDILARGKLPIITGGSGLYIKALSHGLSPTPPADPKLREKCEQLALDELITWLSIIDPEAAATINLKNRRYITRAIEITLLSGRPSSALKKDWQQNPEPSYHGIVITRDREQLYSRINQRTLLMFEQGVVEQVEQLGSSSNTAQKAIGLREIRQFIKGELSREETIQSIQQSTRRFAKRQTTWFRREKGMQNLCIEPKDDPLSIIKQILSIFPHLNS
ncbi:MAG: tRNA (adenosine(37)-N6)-dimethylallyltransferase MiaA [Verrucomicrobiales bacterium]|nr:tRNA (adenosine(37)-N6)-dimethylallyltransferase MiaA [Verrucomicrobiales bacterium]